MSIKKRVDNNQKTIVSQIRKLGATVQHLHIVGHGCPDVVIGFRGVNYLCEIKDPSKPRSARRLTPDEMRWHDGWRGQSCIIETLEDFINISSP